jgi:hypothetical protein
MQEEGFTISRGLPESAGWQYRCGPSGWFDVKLKETPELSKIQYKLTISLYT